MPCSDGGPSREEVEFERRRQRGLAVGLCLACSILDQQGLLPEGLRAWYQVHRNADDCRDWKQSARKEVAALENEAIAAGYSGLSPDHPARRQWQDACRKADLAERREREESANLSELKPEQV